MLAEPEPNHQEPPPTGLPNRHLLTSFLYLESRKLDTFFESPGFKIAGIIGGSYSGIYRHDLSFDTCCHWLPGA